MRRVGLSIVPRRALYFELMKSLTHSPDGNDGDQGPGREPVSVGAVAVGAAALGEPGGVLGYIGLQAVHIGFIQAACMGYTLQAACMLTSA